MEELRAPSNELEDFKYGVLRYINQHGTIETAEIVIRWPKYELNTNDSVTQAERESALNTQFECIFTELQNCGCVANAKDFEPYRKGVPWVK